jgi:hypothetical protein
MTAGHRASAVAPGGQSDRAPGSHRGGLGRVLDQGGGISGAGRPVGADDLGHALKGSAGDPVGWPGHSGRSLDRDRDVDLGELLVPAIAGGLGGQGDRKVRGQGFEPADLDELDAGVTGRTAELLEHLRHERDLAGEVGVMGARANAGLDHRPATKGVGPGEVEHHRRA